jgi:uncharacterized protein involved in cysteine biosynthesis
MINSTTITKTIKDIMSPSVIGFTLKVAFLSLLITLLIMWFTHGLLESFLASYLTWIPWDFLKSAVANLGIILTGYVIFIAAISIFTSLLSDKLLVKIAKKHYSDVEQAGEPKISQTLWVNIKATLLFLLLFIIALPFLFIPILGQIVMLFLWSIMLKEPTEHDINTLFGTHKTKSSRTISLLASLFNYIPLLNIFASVFAQILFLHDMMQKES